MALKKFHFVLHKQSNGKPVSSPTKQEKIFRYAELFSGPGGLALGAKMACFETDKEKFIIKHEWACDYDEDSCETYRRNIYPDNPESVICKDVSKLDLTNLSKIDAFAFGFPCNDFSAVGQQKGINGKFGPLYKYGVKVLRHFKPKFFVAENVGGLRSLTEGRVLIRILEKLHEADYSIPVPCL